MSGAKKDQPRLSLSIAIASKRIGYVVMGEDGELVDYGVKDIPGTNAEKALAHFRALYEAYQPERVCLQDRADKHCKLGKAAKAVIKTIERHLKQQDVKPIMVSKKMVWSSLRVAQKTSKDATARVVVEVYPNFASLLPPKREIWHAEHRNMPIFVATSLGIACLQ